MLTRKILSYKAKGLIKKNLVLRSSMAYNQVNSIGIIFSIDTKEKHEIIKSLVKRLESDGKQVDVLAYLPRKKENYEFLFDYFTGKDLSFWGNFTSETVLKFTQKPFDYLFYIDERSNFLIRTVLAMSKAKCRVAKFDDSNEQFSEMMVQVPGKNQLKHLVDEMYRYTKSLS
jgi:hypothetical protein